MSPFASLHFLSFDCCLGRDLEILSLPEERILTVIVKACEDYFGFLVSILGYH